MNQQLQLRPATDADRDFLHQVYASTREDELALTDWSAAQKAAFTEMQFAAQHSYYLEHYPGATFEIILRNDLPVGRLYLHRRPTEIRIMDIALLPPYRGQGIGSILLNQILDEARAHNLAVTIHVEMYNPALGLYGRLGFQKVADRGVYYFLKWTADGDLSGGADA